MKKNSTSSGPTSRFEGSVMDRPGTRPVAGSIAPPLPHNHEIRIQGPGEAFVSCAGKRRSLSTEKERR